MRASSPNSASAPASGRVSPADGSGDAGTPPRPSRGRTAARTSPPVADPPMPGQTEIELRPMQPTLWSL